MFDFTSSKLLILGIVALIVIGPKDLPALLRTIGKYIGIIKRQAADFRAQFDEAMRESELQQLKKDMESIQRETETAVREAEHSVNKQLSDAQGSVDAALADNKPGTDYLSDPLAPSADGLPAPQSDTAVVPQPAAPAVPGPAEHAEAGGGVPDKSAEPGRTPEKSGV